VAPNIRLVKNSAQMLQLQVQANNQEFFLHLMHYRAVARCVYALARRIAMN